MSFGANLKALRKERGMTLEDLAKLVGTSKQTIQRYESGVITAIPQEKIEALAHALGASPSRFYDREESRHHIPLLGSISCGKPVYAEEEYDLCLENEVGGADFCLRAKGESMVGARIYDGDLVFIRRQDSVDNGEIAAVMVEGETTLKRVYYYPQEEKLILAAENPAYAPLVYVGEELDGIRILGLAVAFQSRVH